VFSSPEANQLARLRSGEVRRTIEDQRASLEPMSLTFVAMGDRAHEALRREEALRDPAQGLRDAAARVELGASTIGARDASVASDGLDGAVVGESAREGGLVPAAKALRLSHPTLSAQIKLLEAQLEAPLFEKVGRKLELTETGRVVYRYAEDIFALGRDLVLAARGHENGQALRLAVGIVDAVPKSVVMHLVKPALALEAAVRLVCVEGSFERLLGDLALHTLDVVIADAPVPPGSAVRAFHHVLGESEVELFATRALAQAHARSFPQSLDGAPMLLPLEGSPLRRALGA
jgi:hypothetical protein